MDRIKQLTALAEANPQNPFAWYALAMETKKNDLAAALAIFDKIRSDHPDYLAAYYHHGQTLTAAGEVDQAREIYREGLQVADKEGDTKTGDEIRAALDVL